MRRNGNNLFVSAGGTLSNNTYKWFRIGQRVPTIINGDSVFHPSQPGTYFVKVTNALAKQLILVSDTMYYEETFVSNGSSIENAIPENNMLSAVFFVYPNPTKDILHIQTAGKATVTLTDQSGKILLTRIINGNGEINVSHLPAGLYYLKNKETGEVQKIIVIKG